MLSDEQRAKVRLHLGYPNVSPVGALNLGVPSANHSLFAVESSMNHLLPSAEVIVIRQIAELDCIMDQVSHARTDLRVASVDEIRMNLEQIPDLWDQYTMWAKMLAQTLGAQINPFAQVHGGQVTVIDPC